MNEQAKRRFLDEKQKFFEPYYLQIVAEYPGGIFQIDVREEAAKRITDEHGFDPFDPLIVGRNDSGAIKSKQWANNLISNNVFIGRLLEVSAENRVKLFPLTRDETAVPLDSGPLDEIDEAVLIEGNNRRPAQTDGSPESKYARMVALAEAVRQEFNYRCCVDDDGCVHFDARSGGSYVEVHHIIPMSMQPKTDVNLDCTMNMVAVCVSCHTKLHHGSLEVSRSVLEVVLLSYETKRGHQFSHTMSDCGLQSSAKCLLSYYGVE